MTEIEIYETGKKVFIPSSWSEMSAEQIRFVFKIYDKVNKDGGSPLDFNLYVISNLLGLKRKGLGRKTLKNAAYTTLVSENLYRLCETCLAFMFENNGEDKFRLTFDSLSNPLPEAGGCYFGPHPLVGPAYLLSDLSFGEFRHAASALETFFNSSDINDLDECIAYLYRRRSFLRNKAGRRVIPIKAGAFAKSVSRAHRLPVWQKNLIMSWFAACLKYIQSGIITVDGENINMKELFSSGEGENSGVKFGWNDLLVQIAKDGAIGDMNSVDEEPLFRIFSIMWHNYKEQKVYEKNVKAKTGN